MCPDVAACASLHAGCWSPTRPAVAYLADSSGNMEVSRRDALSGWLIGWFVGCQKRMHTWLTAAATRRLLSTMRVAHHLCCEASSGLNYALARVCNACTDLQRVLAISECAATQSMVQYCRPKPALPHCQIPDKKFQQASNAAPTSTPVLS